MGWYEELKKSLGEAARQAVGSRTKHTPYIRVTTKTLRFTNKFTQEAIARGLTKKDAEDVYYHGELLAHNKMVRKYNGYEIGIYFFIASDTLHSLSQKPSVMLL